MEKARPQQAIVNRLGTSLRYLLGAMVALSALHVDAAIDLEKATNGVDADDPTGPTIPVGAPVTFSYLITNTGQETLSDITLDDDVLGDITNRCSGDPSASTLPGKCTGRLQEFTVIWPVGQPQINISGLPNDDADGTIDPGQEVTFFPDEGTADVFVNVAVPGGVNGESTFHVSCSDSDMNADNDNDVQPQLPGLQRDCGKFAGDGKNNTSAFIDDWLFEGLVDADGLRLDCTTTIVSIPDLAPGASFACTVPGDPAVAGQYTNLGTVTGTPLVNTLPGKCTGKLQQFTVIWPLGQPQISISGLPNDDPDGVIVPGQEVTFFPDSGTSDVFVDVAGGVNGESKFHVSCSDRDMNADNDNDVQLQRPGLQRDCGKFAGDGKDNFGGFIDDWIFEGLVDANGLKLDCTVADVMDTDPSNHLGAPIPVPMLSPPALVALGVALLGLAAAGIRRIKGSGYPSQD